MTFSDLDESFSSQSPPKKQKLQFHRKRDREEHKEVDNSFEILEENNSFEKEVEEDERSFEDKEQDKFRSAKVDSFNFEKMNSATPSKGTPARRIARTASAKKEPAGELQDGSQYFMYTYQDRMGNQLLNLEVQLQGPAEEGDVNVELVDLPGRRQGIVVSQSLPETWLDTSFYEKFLKVTKPDTYKSRDWQFRSQARMTKILELKSQFGHENGVRSKQLITGLPFEVEDWTIKDAYKGTGVSFESWPICRKKKKKKKKSSSRSARTEYKTRTVGFQNILIVQMVNVEKCNGKDKKKAAKKKTATARKQILLSSSSSSSSSYDSSDDSSLSSNRIRTNNHGRGANDDDDDDISYSNMSVDDENRRSSYGTAGGGDEGDEFDQQQIGRTSAFNMNALFGNGS